AMGRVPNTRGLGLEEAGVELDERGAIVVDAHYRSSAPSIHALGDVIDRIALTPVAINEGMCLADTLFGGRPRALDYDNVPSAVFSQPPLATVGLTEARAQARFGRLRIYE
ncbi:MAG: FAD-dependent oxidoreductase, partial [Gammaproteobacteria bacterium]|nr:FAD-dependent oxidoreductase [Gammaproteobacteria bacterium]